MLHGYQDDLSIERQNVNGNYSPDNCYWATNSTQASNKRKRLGKTSQYIGVAPNKAKWQAYASFHGKRVELGTYSTDIEAAQVRDAYIKE